MTIRRTLLALASAGVAGLLAAAPTPPVARADAVIDVGSGDAVTGTFLPADEAETYRFVVPAGAKLSLVAQGKKKRGATTPTVHVVLRDPSHADLTAAPGLLKPIPGGGKVTNLRISKSGRHTAALTANVTGDYAFSAKWTNPPKPPKATLTFATQSETQTVTFAAGAGTKATFAVAAGKGSQSLPRLVRVAMKDGSWTSQDFAPLANATAKSHTVRNVVLGGAGGDYVLTVSESSATPGAASATIKLTPPKVKARKVNLTTKQTGGSPVNNFAKGGVVGPAGGSVEVADPFDPTPLDGASVEIPSGALANPVVIVVSTANSLDPAGDGQSAGPAVNFGPDGLQFKQAQGGQVLVTIPFDLDDYGGDTSAIDVFVKDSKGKVSLVEPKSSYVIDVNAGTVTFPVSHFSTYQAFGPARPSRADLNADGFDDLVVPAYSAASGDGKVLVFFGRADFATSPPVGPDLTLTPPSGDVDFGLDVAVGDVNGDGIADLAVTSFKNAPPSFGRVSVYFGRAGFASSPPTTPDAQVDGAGPASQSFGEHILIGDVTGDGKGDLIVAATGAESSPDYPGEGAVYVFPGGASFASTTSDDPAAIAVFGGSFQLGFGKSLAIGHVVGDAAADLVVGAITIDEQEAQGPGAVFLVPGGAALVTRQVFGLVPQYDGAASLDQFGDAVAVADLDADGDDDLIVGAPGVDLRGQGLLVDAGAVYVFRGPTLPGGVASENDFTTLPFAQAGERRGAALATGNFVGSPVHDLAFSTPLREGGSLGDVTDAGGLWLFRGGADFVTGVQFTVPGDLRGRFGTRILQPSDLDGDGRDDLATTVPGKDGDAGMVEVYFGQGISAPVFRFTGEPGDRLGER